MPVQLSTRPYALPLRHPWPAKTGPTGERRQGWIIRLTDAEWLGYGDCAPLPGMGMESREQAASALTTLCRQAYPSLNALQDALNAFRTSHPGVFHATESALLDLRSRQQEQPLARYLCPQARRSIAVNLLGGAICHPQTETPHPGCRLIKFKVGLPEPAADLECLQQYCASLPAGVKVRLDANGQWSASQARRFLDAVRHLPIESLEEPVAGGDPGQIESLQAHCRFPLALDESLARLDLQSIISSSKIRRLVLKPMLLGGLERTFSIARQALANGKEVVITSSAESAIGVWGSVHLAAAVDALTPRPMPHGLSTCQWLARDTALPPTIENGHIHLPSGSGLGIRP